MKALFFTLVILGSAFLTYDYFFARPWERVIFEKTARPVVAANPTLPDHVVEDDGLAMQSTQRYWWTRWIYPHHLWG
jgi:hypothetical protein